MRFIMVALVFAISYAQTGIIEIPTSLQDGQTSLVGICSIIENNNQGCSSQATDCVQAYCREADNACFQQGVEYGVPCTTTALDETGNMREVRGVCVDSECVWTVAGECPDPILSAERNFVSCGNAGFDKTWRFAAGTHCLQTGSNCQDVAVSMSNLVCTTSQTRVDPDHQNFEVRYVDVMRTLDDGSDDQCIIGEMDDCVVKDAGVYTFNGMTISWSGTVLTANEITTRFEIPYTTKNLTPMVVCPSGHCRGTITCDMIGPEPCGRVVETCDGTYPPTLGPTMEPTSMPTKTTSTTTAAPNVSTEASSHGDPIIWTFHGDCYDLDVDGTYLATSHPHYKHDVYISVYNYYMREVQVVDKLTGERMLSVNNLGEVINNKFRFNFEESDRKCEPHQGNECLFFYKEYKFDAQDFEYVVQIHPHNYLDPALQEGEAGVHLDIYPRPFSYFQKNEYSGIYFNNPLPEELGECASTE